MKSFNLFCRLNSIVLTAALSLVFGARAERIDVYANAFREGGWKLDVQFMDVMGSPYLLAHGLGSPVPDAVATVTVPTSGKWRVWARTRKWVDGAGAFRVLAGGKALAHVFGRGDPAWGWEDGGEIELAKGAVEIRLRDEDGFDGRCAGLVLASAGERPEGAISVLDRKPEVSRSFDFVVVGGGLPGCCAAIAAARRGLKVALVQDRPVPGGNASGEVRVWSGGEVRYPLVDEVRGKFMNMRYENAFSDSDRIATLEREPNLSLFLLHRAFGVEKRGECIAAVKALDVAKNRVVEFRAPHFCDATGDGWVGFWAGAEWRYGREGRDETGEKFAPEKGDRMTLGSSIMWQSAMATYDVPFSAPWAEPYACGLSRINGDWNWEFGLKQDIMTEGEAVRDRVLLAIYGAFSNAKKNPAHAHLKLVTCPFVLGKRETRRLMGDHVFCEQDVTEKRLFDDAVATGSWSIDLHYTIDEKIPFLTRCEQPHYGRYWIPYRSLYSRNVRNLFMAGRCFSCTHVGLGGPRVMNTLAQFGCAVGEAAAMCVKGGYSPRELYTKGHARELQRNLGGDFPGNPDPARKDWRYVDDESAGVKFKGKWHQSHNANGGQCGDKTSWCAKGADASATYPLPVEKAGRYALKGIVPHLFNLDSAPVVTIVVRSGGRETRLEWNQYVGSGFWQHIETVDLQPGATLELSPSPKCLSRTVAADGFAIVPADEVRTVREQPGQCARRPDPVALPAGWKALAWVESTGLQYVDTGVVHTPETRIDCRVLVRAHQPGPWAALFGARVHCHLRNCFTFFSHGMKTDGGTDPAHGIYNRTKVLAHGPEFPYGKKVALTCAGRAATWTVEGSGATGRIETSAALEGGKNTLFIFNLNTAGENGKLPDTSPACMRLYSFKISEGEKCVRDFMPCRQANGKVGLWDRVEGKFYGNAAGYGEFVGCAVEDRWPLEKAQDWGKRHPWYCGVNYLPANAIAEAKMNARCMCDEK